MDIGLNQKTKTILFDFDGILFHADGYFSTYYEKSAGLSAGTLQPFFEHEFPLCLLGTADLKELLAPHLPTWQWHDGVEAFLAQWFAYGTLDTEMLYRVKALKQRGVRVYLVSNQEKYRAAYIREVLGMEQLFDDCFFSGEMGIAKPDPAFFESVLAQTKSVPEHTLFIDDDPDNIAGAQSVGLQTKLFARSQQ
jgi:putative hydrolase of the HAD superfamily